jgi:D-alanyl-D-alanine carboxypeptidase/D-alanyl-D-alanine-endopeptidase (penicillin-binding protein 4)
VARHRFASEAAVPAPEGVELARRVSPPLDQILQLIDKESLNLGAEMVRRKTGVEELQAFARQVGIGEGECSLVDASGLSVLNLVTPRAMTKLLAFMHQSRNQAAWMALLPVGGEDGTLSRRFPGTAGRIHAKTGSMTHVSALAGYAETASGETLAFSILVNNFTAPNSEIRAIIDRIGVLLIQ